MTGFWIKDTRQGEFLGFDVSTGEALEILYMKDRVLGVKKLNDLKGGCYPSSQEDLRYSKLKKGLCLRILELEKIIKSMEIDNLGKRHGPFPQEIRVGDVGKLDFKEGKYGSLFSFLTIILD